MLRKGRKNKRKEPFKGEINIASDSSLRKRMRAVRRGKAEPWWPATQAKVEAMARRYG